jgi:ABC-type transport system involved in multi-copper enzyme maturation permease subunit
VSGIVIAETVRRHLVRPGYIIFLILVAMTAMFAATFNTPAQMWPWLVSVLAIITGSAIVGPEFLTGTLQLIVSKPISRPSYLVSRVVGVFASVGLAAGIGFAAESAARGLLGRAALPWHRLAEAFGAALLVSLLSIALLTLLGSVTRSYFNVAIYLGTEVAISMTATLVGLVRVKARADAAVDRFAMFDRVLAALDDFLFPAMPAELHRSWIIRVLATAIVSLALACLAFNRREVPYGAE